MSELPRGWVEAELGELVTSHGLVADGDWVESKDQDPKGSVRLTQLADVGDGLFRDKSNRFLTEDKAAELNCTHLEKGDVLIARMPDPLGRACIFPGLKQKAVTVVDVMVWRGGTEEIDSNWIMQAINSPTTRAKILAQASGTTRQRIAGGKLKKLEVPLPPLAEQKRIVAKLDALSARSARARKDLARIDTLVTRYKQAVLSKAFSGELTKDWRIQHTAGEDSLQEVEAAERLKQGRLRIRGASKVLEGIELAKLPVGWNWIQNYRLAQDASNAICAGPFGTIFKAKDFRSQGVPIIFLRHVGEGEYLTHKPNFMDPEVWSNLHQQYSVHGGELLVTKLGDPPGTACIYPEGTGTAMVTPDVMKMSVDECVASKLYLMNYFNSPTCKKMIGELAFGLTRLRVDLGMFKGFPIPLAPISEQQEIVRRVESAFQKIDRLAAEAKRALELTDKLDEAILAKAFRGELVPQDPDDEPASVLLERIKTEREAAPKVKRGRRKKAEPL